MARLELGKVVGKRYQVDGFLGEGGMQEVYLATDTLLGRPVALKRPSTSSAQRRFELSAQLSAQINHSQVARTFDFLKESSTQYLVEELIDGLDLGQLLKRVQRFDPMSVARILHSMARGLAAVHAVGVVHRDLKPSNVMIAGGWRFNEVKITDFGIANMAEAEILSAVSGGVLGLTGSRTLVGHLPYMAPEVLRKKNLKDPRCDIWSVAAMAFHLLTGEAPFGVELADAVMRILTEPVPPLPDFLMQHPQFRLLSTELYGIIVACLRREPTDRPTAAQLVTLCERLCYPILPRELGRVVRYPSGVFGFAEGDTGAIFFHVESVCGTGRPRVGSEVWFARHPGKPHDRAHPVVPVLIEKVDSITPTFENLFGNTVF